MANTQAFTTSAKQKALTALCPNADLLKLALYLASATINAATAAYTATGEAAAGGGYAAGGANVTHATAANRSGTTAFWTPTASVAWANVSIAAFDAALLYNSADANSSISVHTFGSQTVVAGNFTLSMPVNDGTTGLVRIA